MIDSYALLESLKEKCDTQKMINTMNLIISGERYIGEIIIL
jgi:hypothetical protein